jgi:predicted phosphodiesterase
MDSLPTSFGRGGGRINSSAGGRNPNHRGGGGRGRGGGGRNNFRGGGHARGGGRGRFYNNNFARGGGGRGPRGGGGGGGRGRFGRGGRMPPPQNRHHDISKDFIEVIGERSDNSLCIAVEGCCHGELDNIYRRLEAHEQMTGQKVDLLLCCGDFQSLRNAADFHSTSIPPKYRSLGTFPDYYSGAKRAPILTLFIGGNHEASQPLRELHYGGWMAPNIYYMGTAGVVRFGGIRIGGMSGIYSKYDYELGHFGMLYFYAF